MAPLVVDLQVGAVDSDDIALHHSRLKEPSEEMVEDPVVDFLPEAVPELGEKAVAGCPLPESTSLSCFPVMLQPEGYSAVAGDS